MATTAHATRMGRPRHTSPRRRRSDGIVATEGRIRVVAEVAALLLIAVLLVALPILSRDAKTAVATLTTEVIIQPGDTLWSVARSNPQPGMTTAETADHIAALNGYDSSRILVGSSIMVPVRSFGLEVACK